MQGGLINRLKDLLLGLPMRKIIKFGVVGLGATAVHAIVFLVLVDLLGLDPVPSTVAGFVVAFFFSYFTNHAWTFGLEGDHGRFITRYGVVAVTGAGLNASLMHLTTHILGWHHHVGLAAVLTAVALFSLLSNFLWSFRQRAPQGCDNEV
jgi:putative flippase GtrA